MDLIEIAALAGTGLAAFGASWTAFARSMKHRAVSPATHAQLQREMQAAKKEIEATNLSVARLHEARKNADKNAQELARRLERLEEQLRRTVTDEDFGVYTRQTNAAVIGLTERVSRITGFLDASG